jgi:hypothetical protein
VLRFVQRCLLSHVLSFGYYRVGSSTLLLPLLVNAA